MNTDNIIKNFLKETDLVSDPTKHVRVLKCGSCNMISYSNVHLLSLIYPTAQCTEVDNLQLSNRQFVWYCSSVLSPDSKLLHVCCVRALSYTSYSLHTLDSDLFVLPS